MGSHSVTFHPAEVTFLPLPQPKLVLDLATPEGCKAELTWVFPLCLRYSVYRIYQGIIAPTLGKFTPIAPSSITWKERHDGLFDQYRKIIVYLPTNTLW